MIKLRKLISINLSGKKILLLFGITNAFYAIMLTVTIPKTMAFSNGMKLLDMMPLGYSVDYANSLFANLGEKGREVYLYNQIPVDLIYPFLFAISYCLIMAYFLKKINRLNSGFFSFSLLPLVAGISDYFENFGIIYMLLNFPDISQTPILATSVFSIIKSMSTTIYFIALIIILVVLGIRVLAKKKENSSS